MHAATATTLAVRPLNAAHSRGRAAGRPLRTMRSVECVSAGASDPSQGVEFPRRALVGALLLGAAAGAAPGPAHANSTLKFTEAEDLTSNPQLQRGLSKYIKRKQLEPIEYYVPPVLLAQEQLDLVPAAAADAEDKEGYKAVRQYLRVGPFASFRDNCRRIGEYVYLQDKGRKDELEAAVNEAIAKVDAVDSILFKAARGDAVNDGDVAAAVGRANAAIGALLATLPDEVVASSRKVADAAAEQVRDTTAAAVDVTAEAGAEGAGGAAGGGPGGPEAKESSLKALEGIL